MGFVDFITTTLLAVFGRRSTTFGLALQAFHAIDIAWKAWKDSGGDYADFTVELIYNQLDAFAPWVTDRVEKEKVDAILTTAKQLVEQCYAVKEALKG